MEQHNILERIHAAYYELPASERRVADYVLLQYHDVQFMSITQLADECGVADATVSRFCRSLGLKGFNAFKIELAKLSGHKRQEEAPADSSTFEGRCRESARLIQEAVSQTLDPLHHDLVEAVVELFEQADQVLCIGNGGSMVMANECAHLFSTISPKFLSVADSHLQLSAIATMSTRSAVVLFSYSGATRNSLEVLELAASRGIKTVLVTRYPKSPAANLADHVLRCGSNEGPFQFGSIPARVAQLALLDVLFREYYLRNQADCDQNIQQIGAALSIKHI